jgi:hypothetical protein
LAFDSDAFLAALEPPSFVAGGRVYLGRILSVPQWLGIHERKTQMQKAEPTFEQTNEFLIDTVRLMFPRRWYQLYNPAVAAYSRLPYKAQLLALEDFCVSQRNAMPSPPTRDE